MATLDDFFAKRDKKKQKSKKTEPTGKLIQEPKPLESEPEIHTVKPQKTPVVAEPTIEDAPLKEVISTGATQTQKHHFSADAFILVTSVINESLSKNDVLVAAFLDFEGAYDNVNHQILLAKLASAGKPAVDLPNVNASSVYVPPSLRLAQQGARQPRGKPKQAPDINSTDFFPTLEAAVEITPRTKRQIEDETRGFSEARPSRSHSSRVSEQASAAGHLNLGNKFGVLSE
ncbi:hypothetical protein QYM36_006294 [Artemia franciscana]|uniref:Reverse transcriptase domain-containing protein n=1 Tax=Artemia franciscana TaxID=6661 RepID=A0AA88HWB7_ARTSF|nr:hypothetical protein QYM36_006294 [Artemia franciscana]